MICFRIHEQNEKHRKYMQEFFEWVSCLVHECVEFEIICNSMWHEFFSGIHNDTEKDLLRNLE